MIPLLMVVMLQHHQAIQVKRDSLVAFYARRVGVPTALAISVSHVENEPANAHAHNKSGAMGLMQVKPIWTNYFKACGKGSLYQPRKNVCVGVHILRYEYEHRHHSWIQATRFFGERTGIYLVRVNRKMQAIFGMQLTDLDDLRPNLGD